MLLFYKPTLLSIREFTILAHIKYMNGIIQQIV